MISRPLIGGIGCLILLVATLLSNGGTLILAMLSITLVINIGIIIYINSNQDIISENIDSSSANITSSSGEEMDSSDLPDPLEKGFDLPL